MSAVVFCLPAAPTESQKVLVVLACCVGVKALANVAATEVATAAVGMLVGCNVTAAVGILVLGLEAAVGCLVGAAVGCWVGCWVRGLVHFGLATVPTSQYAHRLLGSVVKHQAPPGSRSWFLHQFDQAPATGGVSIGLMTHGVFEPQT